MLQSIENELVLFLALKLCMHTFEVTAVDFKMKIYDEHHFESEKEQYRSCGFEKFIGFFYQLLPALDSTRYRENDKHHEYDGNEDVESRRFSARNENL